MTDIDPDVRAILDEMNASMPAPTDFDVAAFRAEAERRSPPLSTIALAGIEDTTIPGPDGPLPIRIYRPDHGDDRPVILYLHGGAFIMTGLDNEDEYCRRLAAGTGSIVCALDIRPAPEHPFPAAVDDAFAAIEHLDREGSSFGADPAKVGIAGMSSGATIAAGTALRSRDAGGPPVALQILLVPLLRHYADTPSRRIYGNGEHGITTDFLDWASDQYAPGDLAAHPYSAPLHADDLSGLPTTYIHTAELDPVRDDGADYAQRLRRADVPVQHRDAPGLFHGFHFFGDALPDAREELTTEMNTIRRLLADPTA